MRKWKWGEGRGSEVRWDERRRAFMMRGRYVVREVMA
jgi:hypothetical protein